MKNIKSLLLIITFFTIGSTVTAQKNKRISFQVSPLYSYLDIQYKKYAFRNNYGIEDPQSGISSAVKFEVELNNLLSVSTGLSYERRKNYYETGMLYDTIKTTMLGDPSPYKYTSSRTYDFIGIPIALHFNYLNNSKLRIYQTFGTQFSFLVSAQDQGVLYYEKGVDINFKRNDIDNKTDVIISLSSSIGLCKYITERVAFKIEPGINYMATNFLESDWAKRKYFDFKVDVGIVYNLKNNKD